MEKFQKAFDGLKSGGTINKKKDVALTSKDKIGYCQAITEAVQSQQFKQHADFAKQFSAAFEILFTLCDDSNLDVRVYVDECLNTIIRSNLSEGNATRVHCELYQEIKRNGSARCLRSALVKFADLASQIRPNRCRTFAKNLLSSFVAVIRRPEEAIQECFGSAVEKIFAVLGRFFSDEETKILIKSVLPNLQLQSAASRRTAAVFVVELCRNSRKRYTFVSYLFKALLDTLVPVQFDQSVLQLLGTFFTLRQLIPVLKACEDDDDLGEELRVTQTGTIKLRPHTSLTTEQFIQFYEAIVYYLSYPHSSVVTAAMETLNQLLVYGPRPLLQVLLSETEGIGKSRIFASVPPGSLSRSRKGSFSGIRSGVSSLGGSQSDLTTLAFGDLSMDDPMLFPADTTSPLPPTVPSTGQLDEDTPLTMTVRSDMEFEGSGQQRVDNQAYSSMQMGELVDDNSVGSLVTGMNQREVNKLARELTPLYLLEGGNEPETQFSDPTSPLSPLFLRESGFPDDIGTFAETRPPLMYCGRLLCRKFLLAGSMGELIADKDVRVSHKVLALGCLESLCNLYPAVLDNGLTPGQETSQHISDVLLFVNHDDPQIKGNISTLASSWLKSATVASGHKIEALPQQVTCEVVRVLSKTLLDESGVAARLAVVALTKCYGELLEYDVAACLRLLRQAAGLAKNPYWLLKVAVAELLSEIDYCSILSGELANTESNVSEDERFAELSMEKLINVLLMDEDPRVRQSASNAVVGLVEKLCLNSSNPDETAFTRRIDRSMEDFEFSWHLDGFPPVHCLAPNYKQIKDGQNRKRSSSKAYLEENLSCLVDRLIRALCQAVDKNHMIGCLTGLQKLSESYSPSLYESAWCMTNRAKPGSLIDLLSMLLSILKSIPFGGDTQIVHQILFSLIGSLFSGAALQDLTARNQRKPESTANERWPSLTSSSLGELASELFNYCLRIVSIYWHAVTDQHREPPPVLTKPPLPQLPQAPSLAPVANKLKAVAGVKMENKGQEKVDQNQSQAPPAALPTAKYKAADFYSSIHLMRVFEMVKGAWSNFRISLDSDVEEKFCLLLRSCLDCMNSLLEVASIGDVEKYTEELLAYLKPLMPILPAEVVNTVIQLLKSLFGTNLPMLFHQLTNPVAFSSPSTSMMPLTAKRVHATNEDSVHHNCVVKQRTKFFNQLTSSVARHDICSDLMKQHLGWFGSRGERHVLSLLKNASNKATLTNYIRLFEPIVVQGLRLYTSCVCVELQCGVIGLLSQLIQIRVNYSLLDTDRRFLDFLFQQLENIEEGHMRNAETLTRKLFEFFTLLSYEKYQSVAVLEVPKLLQLADGLLASSQNGKGSGMLGALALHPVVLDLYFVRSASKLEAVKELEIQQEVVASMLIKCIRCGGPTFSLLSFILYQTHKDNESKWRKLSRDIVDVLLPLMAKNQISLKNCDDLGTVLALTDFVCSSAFRPVDPLLTLMLTQANPGATVEEFCSWLACQIWSLRILILYSNEAAIASRLEEMPSVVVGATWLVGQGGQAGFVDPLGSTLQTNFEEIFARLLVSISKLMMERLGEILTARPVSSSLAYLEQLCQYFINMLVHICQSGDYSKFSASFAQLLESGVITLDECIARSCPQLAISWFYLLSTTKVDNVPCWKLASEYGISPTLRQCMILFYCDRLKESILVNSENILATLDSFLSNNMDVFDWFEEAPVKEFLTFALKQTSTNRIVLSKLDQILNGEIILKPSRAVKLLQCLELTNFESSVLVLDIITRFMVRCNQLAVAKIAGTLALKTLDILMVNRVEETKAMLPVEVLRNLMARFDDGRKRRYAVLYGRLDQVFRNWYPNEYADMLKLDQAPVDDLSMAEAGLSKLGFVSSPTKFNRVKFLEFLQTVLRSEKRNVGMCAEALGSLSIDDVTEILVDERTTPRLLVACLMAEERASQSSTWNRTQSPPAGRKCKISEIADAARRSLLAAIRTVMGNVPKHFRPVFTCRDFSINGECDQNVTDRILDLSHGVEVLFKNSRLKSTLTESELRMLIGYLVTTMTVCLKRLDSIRLSHARRLANLFISAFCNEHFCRILATPEFLENHLQLIGGSFWLCSKGLRIKDLSQFVDDLPVVIEDPGLRTAWQYCHAYLRWIESKSSNPMTVCQSVAKGLFVGLCRLPSVTSFTHIPPSAFKFGWTPELRVAANGYANLPTVPVHYLQNVETLREFIFRVNTLGWSSRQQFEEIWMGLLGVLSATTIGRELLNNSVQETEDRIVASSFAVRCLAALLLQTLLTPTPGNPLASSYVLKPREKQSTFLKTTFGTKLSELRQNLRRHKEGAKDCFPFGFNPERLHDRGDYSMGQLSVDTLWSLTGILAEERDLVSALPRSPPASVRFYNMRISDAVEAVATTPSVEMAPEIAVQDEEKQGRGASFVSYMDDGQPKQMEEHMAVRRSTSNFLLVSESGLDLVSCLHFLLDLFTHWFAGGPDDIPLALLSATVESVLYLSDLFSERSQYIWLRERLLAVFQNRLSLVEERYDELILQDVLLGLLKCSAVLGMNDADKQKEAVGFMEAGLSNPQLSVRLATVHGILYVLQSLTSDETISLMPMLTDYISPHISIVLNGDVNRNLEKPQSLEHQLAVWALGFYMVEAFHDPHTKTAFAPKFTELCCKGMQTDSVSIIVLDCVINGLESLLVSTPVEGRLVGQLTKLATEKVQKPSSPQAAVLAMELLLTCLYTSKENRRFGDAVTPDTEMAPRIAGEPHISAMERLTVLLNRVTEGSRFEATAIGMFLPDFLADHFSPSDVMNKVIIELLNPMQPHPQVLIRALHSLIEALLQQEVATVVCDWVLVSLPSFTCKNPAHFSVWALTCLLLSASTNAWVKALWPLAMSRYNANESPLDTHLFCFAVNAFYSQLSEKSQIDTLLQTVRKAAERHPYSAYARAYENLVQIGKEQ